MDQEGPLLESLTRRLAECPGEFLAEPCIGTAGVVHVAAVVSDLLRDLGGALLSADEAKAFTPTDRQRKNWLRTVLVAVWLVSDPWFRTRTQLAPAIRGLLLQGLTTLAALVSAPQLVSDPDRREELVRLCLHALRLRPAGETVAQAQDRLTTLSSVERQRVIKESQAAEERARQVREAMAKKAAAEAAARYGSE